MTLLCIYNIMCLLYRVYLTSTEENTAVFYLRYSSRLDGLAYDEILTVSVGRCWMVGIVFGIIYGHTKSKTST